MIGQAVAQRAPGAQAERPAEYLTFRLGAEEYGIDILKVQEIRGWETPTAIAGAPDCVKGVINLRGTIVPVVDMRVKFGLGDVRYDAFTVVIILNVAARVVGMVVDSVSDVVTLAAEQVRPAPTFAGALEAAISGLGTVDGRMLILLDIERLMGAADMGFGASIN